MQCSPYLLKTYETEEIEFQHINKLNDLKRDLNYIWMCVYIYLCLPPKGLIHS